MIVMGLTGGIASGKSTVAETLRSYKGACHIDADAIAYELSEPGQPMWQSYVDHFGKEKALLPDGSLNRAGIGEIVFHHPEERSWMDGMAHPLIRKEIQRRVEEAREAGKLVAILDVPLLFEVGWDKLVDKIWVVYVNPATQLSRLIARNGLTEEAAKARIASQMSLEEKASRADMIIDNNGGLQELLSQIERAWQSLTAEAKG